MTLDMIILCKFAGKQVLAFNEMSITPKRLAWPDRAGILMGDFKAMFFMTLTEFCQITRQNFESVRLRTEQ